jgi:hypothetical protein
LGERQTPQSQPSMGTPTDVPVPRKMKVREPAITLPEQGEGDDWPL